MSRPRRPRRRRHHAGSVLVLMIPMLLVFFGFAALVIDLGLVRVTQARMTSATDAASLEALRWRDQLPPAAVGTNLDQNRRAAAAALVATTFSGDQDAGPQFDVGHQPGGSAADVDAFAVVTPATDATGAYAGGYRPTVQLNMNGAGTAAVNDVQGDLVAGTYLPDPTLSHREGTAAGGTDQPYARADFIPDAAGTTPPGLSVLARLRRTRETAVAGVSSVGPTLPLLFGRGAAVGGAEAGSAYSVRRDGISVRATSIATAAPVVSVGLPVVVDGTTVAQGAVAVALDRAAWEGLLPAAAAQGTPTPVAVGRVGNRLTLGAAVVGYSLATPATTIGPAVVAGGTLPVAVTGYFPIVDGTMAPPRVVGFGWATLTAGTLAKRATAGGAVAPWNASADLLDAWAALDPRRRGGGPVGQRRPERPAAGRRVGPGDGRLKTPTWIPNPKS